jgi:hypothetical protein
VEAGNQDPVVIIGDVVIGDKNIGKIFSAIDVISGAFFNQIFYP